MPDPWGSFTSRVDTKPKSSAESWLLSKPLGPAHDSQSSTQTAQPSLPWGYPPGQQGLQSLSDDSSQKSLSPVGTVASLSELAGDLERADAQLASLAGAAGPETDDTEAGDPEAGRRRTEFLSEKNRKAQKRYRERQRERFADFKQQVDALTQQVKSLTHDKECLQSRNDLLETMMEEELKCVGGATRALTSGHATETPDPASAEETENALGMDDLCRSILRNLPPSQSRTPVNGGKLYTFNDLVVLYQALCNEFARLLANGAEDPDSPLHKDLLRIHQIHITDIAHHFAKRPVLLRRIQVATCLNSGPVTDKDPVYLKAAATLKLTPEQVQTVIAARDAFKKGIKNCAERRRSCLGMLAVAPGERLDCVNSEGRLSELFVQEVEAADKAKATVMEEHKLRDDLAHAFRKLLTPAQYCRWTVEVYPHASDWLALAHAVEVLEERKAAPALEERKGASALPSNLAPAPSFSDDLFDDLSFSQADENFLQEFDFLQPDRTQRAALASTAAQPLSPTPSWLPGISNTVAKG